MLYNPGPSRDFRIGGSGRKWHLWTSVQGWWEPPSVCVCQSLRCEHEEVENGTQTTLFVFLLTSCHHIYQSTASLHSVPLVLGLDYLWFSPCFTSTHFSDAHIIPVHLFWSRGAPSFLLSRPHPSQIFCAYYTLCIALIRPNPSVHGSLHHADRLVRHWVGGVSLRSCAQHCPAGLLLE